MHVLRASLLATILSLFATGVVSAHPLGNFTSNHLTRLRVQASDVLVHYVLDDAEIPTFSLLRSLDPEGRPSQPVLATWGVQHAIEIAPQLELTSDGKPLTLTPVGTSVRLRPGAGGLATLYFTADYRTALAPGPHALTYADTTLADRIGWRDVVVSPATEPTHELRVYPNALIGSPRDRTAVALSRSATGIVAVTDTTGASVFGTPSAARMDALSNVLGRDLSDPLVLIGALLLAIGLGALHALEPGHGKTLLAISLVGARATVPQAAILAAALTIAHTAGVLLFGVVVLSLTRYVVPETLYPWIAVLSGAFVAVLGARALAKTIVQRRVQVASAPTGPKTDAELARAALRAHDHAHAQGLAHDHGDLDDDAHARAHAIPGSAPLRFRDALIAAASGNVAPCPAALVVLLAAIATHRIGYGLVLIVAFSIGLALTLTILGVAVVRGAGWLMRRPHFDRVAAYAPLVTATAISVIGAWMLGEGIAARAPWPPAIVAAVVLALIAAYTSLAVARVKRPHFSRSAPA
jgi:ABC-type nickel/cobalt efflux system permease component RcnA